MAQQAARGKRLPVHPSEPGRVRRVGDGPAPRRRLLLPPKVGIGLQYKYKNYSYDRGILVCKLGGETHEGFPVFASFLL